MCWDCRRSPFLAVSQLLACRLASRLSVLRSRSQQFWRWRMLTSRRPSGTRSVRGWVPNAPSTHRREHRNGGTAGKIGKIGDDCRPHVSSPASCRILPVIVARIVTISDNEPRVRVCYQYRSLPVFVTFSVNLHRGLLGLSPSFLWVHAACQ